MENKTKKSKQLRIDADLFYILKKVSVKNERWSKTARKYLWNYCNVFHPEAVEEIEKSYDLVAVLENEPIVKEIIKNESSNL